VWANTCTFKTTLYLLGVMGFATAMFYVVINKIEIIPKIQNKQSYLCVKTAKLMLPLEVESRIYKCKPCM